MTKKLTDRWANRAGYLCSFACSYWAAWQHEPSVALFFFGIAFFFLSRTYNG
jgi:hypothetical protein